MARHPTFEVQCVNVRVHTQHHASEYEALWKSVGRMRTPVLWRSGIALMIGESARRQSDPAEGFFGHFYRFIQINTDDPWFDIARNKPADADDIAQVSIPAHLRPNLQMFPYFFDIHKHRLYFIAHTGKDNLTGTAVVKLLGELVSTPSIQQRFGDVDLTIATQAEAVDKLLDWPVLQRLTIKIERPNPTDFDDEAAVFRRLDRFGVQSERRDYVKASDRPTIRLNDELRGLARVAGDNGEVEVTGKDHNGKRRTANSQQFKWFLKHTYNQKIQTLTGAFLEVVSDLFSKRL